MKKSTIVAYAICAAADVFLARFELHTNDAGVVALLIVLFTLVLGCVHPKYAWQWALFVGPIVPAADILFRSVRVGSQNLEGLGLLAVFVVLLGLAGSYSGVFLRRRISALDRRAG
jgi:hypothetical protein